MNQYFAVIANVLINPVQRQVKLFIGRTGMIEYRNIQIIHIIAVTGPVEAVEFCGNIKNTIDALVAEFFDIVTD